MDGYAGKIDIFMGAIWIYHFTHIENLPGIIKHGLLADNVIDPACYRNSGNQEIKAYRKSKPVCDGKYVGDYVPFYFAPRSPMLYRQHSMGLIQNEKIIYLITDAASIVKNISGAVQT